MECTDVSPYWYFTCVRHMFFNSRWSVLSLFLNRHVLCSRSRVLVGLHVPYRTYWKLVSMLCQISFSCLVIYIVQLQSKWSTANSAKYGTAIESVTKSLEFSFRASLIVLQFFLSSEKMHLHDLRRTFMLVKSTSNITESSKPFLFLFFHLPLW